MNITVRLFARAKELAGANAVTVQAPSTARVGDLREAIAKTYPQLANLVPKCVIAVGDEFVEDNAAIPRNAEIALLPPVSGGSS